MHFTAHRFDADYFQVVYMGRIEQISIFNISGLSPKKEEYSELGIPIHTQEFWTSRQRQANSIHEISYRACYKPQLPEFFINKHY